MSKSKELLTLLEDDQQSVDILVKLIRKHMHELDLYIEELSMRFEDGDQKAIFAELKNIANVTGRFLK